MPTIKFTTQIAENIAGQYGIRYSGSASQCGMTSTALNSEARLWIMSGAVPTQNDIDLNGEQDWNRLIGSPSEVLMERKVSSSTEFDSWSVGDDAYVVWNLVSTIAINSGVASWWLWSGYQLWNPVDRGNNPTGGTDWMGMLIGDITILGGGGSMTLADTNILAGERYELGPAKFLIPRTYTYT